MIREAYCSTELSKILVAAGYHGDNINGLYVPGDEADINEYYITLSCAMRWLREEKDIYLNIRVNPIHVSSLGIVILGQGFVINRIPLSSSLYSNMAAL